MFFLRLRSKVPPEEYGEGSGRMASSVAKTENHARVPATRSMASLHIPSTGAFQIAASLLWIPQAAFVATAIGDLTATSPNDRLLSLAFGILVLGVLKAVLDAVGSRRAFSVAREVTTALRLDAVEAVARRSPLDVSRAESGRLASVLGEQAEMIIPYLARFRTAKTKAVIVPLVILLFIFSQSWAAALVLLFAAPLIPVFMILIGWNAKAESEAQLLQTGDMNAFLLDRLRGIRTIRTLDAVDQTAKRLRANAESLRRRTMKVLRIAFLSSAALELFSAIGVAMVAVYVGFHLLGQLNFGTWNQPLDLSQGLFILLLAPAFFEPLRELSSFWHDRASGEAAIKALQTLAVEGRGLVGEAGQGPENYLVTKSPPVLVSNIAFRHFGAKEDVLSNFSLAIGSGEHVAILGPSGSGKSTLRGLLIGLAAPTSGSISIGGRKISAATASALRREIAWIGQRPHIFSGTLASNVRLGRQIPGERVARALEFAQLSPLAERRGLDSIGEGGFGLSGGETLRLALARIAADPAVGLILADEPTAHLDAETAREITDNLLALAEGRTLIVATHDLTLARRMDRIICMSNVSLEQAA